MQDAAQIAFIPVPARAPIPTPTVTDGFNLITAVVAAIVLACVLMGVYLLHQQPPFPTDDLSSILYQSG